MGADDPIEMDDDEMNGKSQATRSGSTKGVGRRASAVRTVVGRLCRVVVTRPRDVCARVGGLCHAWGSPTERPLGRPRLVRHLVEDAHG